jgi:RNA polymerase sigma factor (TIGR02999 family)
VAEPSDRPIGVLVDSANAGDLRAKDELFATLYGELRRLAQVHIARSSGPVTLSATTLLHEAYLDICEREGLAFPDRHHFLAYASRAMRGLIIDYLRAKQAVKRGGDLTFLSVEEAEPAASDELLAFEDLALALQELEAIDPELAQLVDLKFFCGFTFPELAAMRGVSERTVQRDWGKARMLLHSSLSTTE